MEGSLEIKRVRRDWANGSPDFILSTVRVILKEKECSYSWAFVFTHITAIKRYIPKDSLRDNFGHLILDFN